jgi:hypothetical protein
MTVTGTCTGPDGAALFTVIDPEHTPLLMPAVATLTVATAGVKFGNNATVSHPDPQVEVLGATVICEGWPVLAI